MDDYEKIPGSKTSPTSKSTNGKIPKEVWIRGLYMVLFFFVTYLVWFLILAVSIFQFIASLLFKSSNRQLESFGRDLGNYYNQIIQFLTYNTEQKPYPFDTWPGKR